MVSPEEGFQLSIEIRLQAPYNSPAAYGNLQVREEFQIPAVNFMDLAAILGRFHELAQQIKGERT